MSDNTELKWYGWGLANKSFDLKRRTNFWPYLNERLQITSNTPSLPVDIRDIKLPPVNDAGLAGRFAELLGANAVRTDSLARITHALGKSYIDLVRGRQGQIENAPDLVLYPQNESQVFEILKIAAQSRAAIIPFGGGTSVVGGIEAIKESGQSAAISLDLTRLTKIGEIDELSRLVTIEAGIKGPDLERELQSRGYTLGHYPQSFEFSTLGGWVATRSAGQQSNKYGRIEDMVFSVTMATPKDIVTSTEVPATATGPSVKELIVGSEGLYGVITKAKMRIQKLPPHRQYRGVMFKDFFFGSQAIRTIVQQGLTPTTMRLSDEAETEAIMKMRVESESVFESALAKAGKWYLKNRGYVKETCLMILGFEGDEATIKHETKAALDICNQHNGIDLGLRVGEHWYRDRFELPYLRDTLLDQSIMLDTLETCTTWSNLLEVYTRVKEALVDGVKSFDFKLQPLVFCHISHSYIDGASLYFTFLTKQAKTKELEQWQIVKKAASQAILASGGTISHHHGVGRDHAPWAKREHGSLAIAALANVKHAFDPAGILNPGKFLL